MKQHNKQVNALSPYIVSLITYLALLPLVYFIPDYVGYFLPKIKWLNVLVVVSIIVPIISFLIIPLAKKLNTLIQKKLSLG